MKHKQDSSRKICIKKGIKKKVKLNKTHDSVSNLIAKLDLSGKQKKTIDSSQKNDQTENKNEDDNKTKIADVLKEMQDLSMTKKSAKETKKTLFKKIQRVGWVKKDKIKNSVYYKKVKQPRHKHLDKWLNKRHELNKLVDDDILQMAEIIKTSLEKEKTKKKGVKKRKSRNRVKSDAQMKKSIVVFPNILSNDISINNGYKDKKLDPNCFTNGLIKIDNRY